MGRKAVKIVADTNVLLRDALSDDPRQSPIAGKVLQNADLVAIPVVVLCEFVWVLCQGYKIPELEVANSIRSLTVGTS
jgi:predicted nucleic-acid-binding protein